MNLELNSVRMPLVLLAAVTGMAAARGDVGAGSVWDGVYSNEQAQRGELAYQQHCQSCHAADMRGGPAARGLVGMGFQYLWQDRSLAQLLAAMREKMPPGNPGSLDEVVYSAILAAVLQRNGFPAGDRDLQAGAEALDAIRLNWGPP